MNYNKTTKPKLIEMLKTAQAENVRLAGNADKAEEIATATMRNNATLREDVKEQGELILFQQTDIYDKRKLIADLEKQIAGNGRVDGVFSMGDRVVSEDYNAHPAWRKRYQTVGTVISETVESSGLMKIDFDCDAGASCWVKPFQIRHADAAPPCPSCKAKDAEIAKLKRSRDGWEHDAKTYAKNADHHKAKLDDTINKYRNFKNAVQDEIGYANDDESALTGEIRRRLTFASNKVSDLNNRIEDYQSEIDQLKKESHRDWLKSDKTDTELFNKTLEYKELKQLYENQQSTIESLQSDFDATHTMNLHLRDAVIRGQVEVSKVRSGEVG